MACLPTPTLVVPSPRGVTSCYGLASKPNVDAEVGGGALGVWGGLRGEQGAHGWTLQRAVESGFGALLGGALYLVMRGARRGVRAYNLLPHPHAATSSRGCRCQNAQKQTHTSLRGAFAASCRAGGSTAAAGGRIKNASARRRERGVGHSVIKSINTPAFPCRTHSTLSGGRVVPHRVTTLSRVLLATCQGTLRRCSSADFTVIRRLLLV